MDIAEVTDKVRKFLVEEFEVDACKIKADASLKSDIGIDSLDFVDIVVIVEEIFGLEISAVEVEKIGTFGEFCDYIQQKTELRSL